MNVIPPKPPLSPDMMMPMGAGPARLYDLPMMDIYVRIDRTGEARYRSPARDMSNTWSRPLPDDYMPDAMRMAEKIRSELDNPDSSFEYDGMRFRLSYQKLASGAEWIILRKINPNVATLVSLGYPPHIATMLTGLGRRDGLIMISGATGHGKTTTSFALLREYLIRFGGVGITVEDPVEYALDGPVGEHGYCYQVQVDNNEDWATPLKRALRWTPRYILVGEVRSPKAAEQILRAATTGHLVITTIHAGSIEESFMGLMHLASQTMEQGANFMLAQGLTAACHQTLNVNGPYLRYIVTEEGNSGDPVRALIRDNRVGMINTYIDKQIARMNMIAGANSIPPGAKK
ncbi:MAG: ATPase, T2SS/T4P/T4SS family [Alphaproteobacteria bacterium]